MAPSFFINAQEAWLGIERRFDGESAALKDVGVDHGGFDVFVSEEFLNGADVVSVLEKVCGEGVAEGVRGDAFVYFGGFDGVSNCTLEGGLVNMMAARNAGLRIGI